MFNDQFFRLSKLSALLIKLVTNSMFDMKTYLITILSVFVHLSLSLFLI